MSTLAFKQTTQTLARSAGLFAALRREWSYLLAGRAMNRLDDAALQDVGVARGSIDDVVRHGR